MPHTPARRTPTLRFRPVRLLRAHKRWVLGSEVLPQRLTTGMVHLVGADLSRADLRRADLSGEDLRNADLSEANLSDTVAMGIDLTNANLSRAYIKGAMMQKARRRPIDARMG